VQRAIFGLVLLLSCALVGASGPKPATIVGTWIVDRASAPKGAVPVGLELTFMKGGTVTVRGPNIVAVGTYKVTGNKVTLEITKRNGVAPRNPKTSAGVFTIVDAGKALLGDSGIRRGGKVVMMRLVRKK